MNSPHFPAGAMIPPEFRKDLLALKKNREKTAMPVHDEQALRRFQQLVQRSLQSGTVIQVITGTGRQKLSTTGIVIKAEPLSGKLTLETIEGERTVFSGQITDINEFKAAFHSSP